MQRAGKNFKAIVANLQPLDKAGSIFHKGRFSASALAQMARMASQGVPLHRLHRTDDELPIGRVFSGEVLGSELQVLFYVSPNKPDIEADIDAGIINEVSVSVRPSSLLCSKCRAEYMGDARAIMNATCPNGHDDPVIIDAIDKFLELSLVSRGAAQGTSILPASLNHGLVLTASLLQTVPTNNTTAFKSLRSKPVVGAFRTNREPVSSNPYKRRV